MRRRTIFLAAAAISALPTLPSSAVLLAQTALPAARDGSHDFDFAQGTWHTDITRYKDPLSRSPQAVRLAGTVTVRPVWNGRAWLEEIEADGPDGHWQAMTLFLYNPESRQWSQNFANSRQGRYASAPLIGERRDGRIELYAQDTLGSRTILVRGLWSDIERDSHKYQEDYSEDGGRTWRRAFAGVLTRARG